MAEHNRHRKPRNPLNPEPTDPTPIRSKPTISSVLLSSTPNNDNNNSNNSKKKNFSSATFRGLGCTASSQVSVPAVIRTSANWETKKVKKKRFKTKRSADNNRPPSTNNTNGIVMSNGNPISQSSLSLALSSSCVSKPDDVWCGAGIGLSTDAASVDCVVSRRPPAPTRGKLDGRSCAPRRMVTPEDIPFLEADSSMGMSRFHADISSARHSRHVRHGFREGLAEIVMLNGDMLMSGRFHGLDGYRDLRLDVDNMTYEELLELGDKIGYVSTGLREDAMSRCLRRSKITMSGNLSSLFASELEKKCTICQEEYGQEDETGRLTECGHVFHIECIKQWLGQKNICPICKTAALPKN